MLVGRVGSQQATKDSHGTWKSLEAVALPVWKTWPGYPDSIHVIVIIVTDLENLLRRYPSITGLVETNHT